MCFLCTKAYVFQGLGSCFKLSRNFLITMMPHIVSGIYLLCVPKQEDYLEGEKMWSNLEGKF